MKELARRYFLSLNYCNIDHAYFILCDQNFREKFFADSDAEAIEYFNNWEG